MLVQNLCLGHANLGTYSCMAEATESIDDHGEGFCYEHAEYARSALPNEMVCYRCRYLVRSPMQPDSFIWSEPLLECTRCSGTGIDPVCRQVIDAQS